MQTGTVVWFENSRGYGFIASDEGGREYFVHHKNIQMEGYRKLEKGQRVSFNVEIGPKEKPQAINVCVLKEDAGNGRASVAVHEHE